MGTEVRHDYVERWPIINRCWRCKKGRSNRRAHRVGSRCSVCFRYYRRHELDVSRRCNDCRP